MNRSRLWAASLGIFLILAGCGKSPAPQGESAGSGVKARSGPVSMNKDDYPVFPRADEGADPAVPAEQGGKGFTGEGWQTNTSFDLIGDPHAVKGGALRETASDFPATLRSLGPNTTSYGSSISSKVYETLLNMHPTTLEYIPGLASHWKISPDKMTYWFRIDPRARWSDGQPVVADDVVASWSFYMDKGLADPPLPLIFGKFDKPVAESKYIVRVKTNKVSWRNFLYFSNSMWIFPAHVLKTLDGERFIKEYNYKMMPGSGPYIINESDVEKGKFIRMRRRKDYWAENDRRNIGSYNFDELRTGVVRDRNLEFEMFKKGDLDYYLVNRAQMWQEELNIDQIQRGLILKRRVWNHAPQGIVGSAFNTRRPPFDDIRVRKAIRLLYNREQMIAKLMFNAYTPMNSTYPETMWENPANEKIGYDPKKALELLTEAGFKSRDSQGRLVRNGVPLTLELIYPDKGSDQYLTVFQEDLRKVGITLNLRLVTFETLVKLLDERQFDLVLIGYTGSLFPDPEASILSSLADQKNSNNITGFKNSRVDELVKQYDTAYEIPDRMKIIREIDKLYTDSHSWILNWVAPYSRVVFWNRYGMPKGTFTRIGGLDDISTLWWIDPDKERALEEARKDSSKKLDPGQVEDKYWMEFSRAEETEQKKM